MCLMEHVPDDPFSKLNRPCPLSCTAFGFVFKSSWNYICAPMSIGVVWSEWIVADWSGLACTGVDWSGLEWIEVDWSALEYEVGSGWIQALRLLPIGGERLIEGDLREIHDFEDDGHGRCESDDLARGQAQLLVVVQDGVEILDPHGVYWAVENDPLSSRKRRSRELSVLSDRGKGSD